MEMLHSLSFEMDFYRQLKPQEEVAWRREEMWISFGTLLRRLTLGELIL